MSDQTSSGGQSKEPLPKSPPEPLPTSVTVSDRVEANSAEPAQQCKVIHCSSAPRRRSLSEVTIADLINFFMLLAIGGTFLIARNQFDQAKRQADIASSDLTYTFLLQLRRDTDEITNFVSVDATALRRMAALNCDIPDNSDQSAKAEDETNHILDYYEFYYRAWHDYDLIHNPSWNQICSGSSDLFNDNCFLKNNVIRILTKRSDIGFRDSMAACVTAK